MPKLKMIDLCAGTGAFTHVFTRTNKVECVFSNDLDISSKKCYDLNFSHKLTPGNICDINVGDIPKHDILTAGFPCQPFSIAGKRNGFDDPRSNVFWKIIEIIKHHLPKCVVLENVKNLKSHDNGDTFKTIRKSLRDAGYFVKYAVINTCDMTEIPQNRERIYIVCMRNKELLEKFHFVYPHVDCRKINEMLEQNVDEKYYYNDKNSKIHKMVRNAVVNKDTVYQYRRVYVRENKNNVCPTLTANMGTGGHNVPIILDDKGVRKLTPRECFNFQGFPENYNLPKLCDSKLYKLAGNAVSVPVAKGIADNLLEILV
jgi:DNA (cytosine-5)-methyltransferase 1